MTERAPEQPDGTKARHIPLALAETPGHKVSGITGHQQLNSPSVGLLASACSLSGSNARP